MRVLRHRCTVCTHPQRAAIEVELLGAHPPIRALARRHGVSHQALLRHRSRRPGDARSHMREDPVPAPPPPPLPQARRRSRWHGQVHAPRHADYCPGCQGRWWWLLGQGAGQVGGCLRCVPPPVGVAVWRFEGAAYRVS